MRDAFAEALRGWHADLMADRAARAGLRRARSLDDVLLDGAAASAFMRLWRHKPSKEPPYPLARAALALAEIDVDPEPDSEAKGAFARRCAAEEKSQVLVSPDRFRLLMSATDADDFLRLLRSAIDQVKRRAPLHDVADLVYWWSHPVSRERMRRQQLLAYYNAIPEDALKRQE